MKKTLVLVVFFLVVVTGCGSGEKGEVKLRMSWWGGDTRHAATLQVIERFEQLNPGIKVTGEYTGWEGHLEKITTQLGGGTAPDLMQINWNWLVLFSKKGTGFYDLKKLSQEVGLENYSDEILQYVTINGKVNGLPVSTTGRELFWNKTVFDRFGASYPKTWDELFELGSKFKDGFYPLDLTEQDAILLGCVYVEQLTGKMMISPTGKLEYTVDDFKELLGFYKKLQDLKITQGIKNRNAEGGGRNAPLFQMQAYMKGNYAGVFTWDSTYNKYAKPLEENKQVLELGSLPIMENAKSKGWIVKPSMLFCINKNTKYPKETAKLLNFMMNDPEGVKILGLERSIPVSKSAYDTLSAEGKIKGVTNDALNLVLKNAGRGYSPYLENPQLAEITYQAIENLSYGKGTVDELAQGLHDDVQAMLDKIVK